MKRITKTFCSILASIFIGLSSLVAMGGTALAAGCSAGDTGATISLQPSSGSYNVGDVFSVGVYENSNDDCVNAVQANLSYQTSLLSYQNYSSSAAFNIDAQDPSGDTGNLRFARGTLSPTQNSQLVVTIQFKAVAAGSASVTFDSSTAVTNSVTHNADTPLGKVNGNFTISTPAPPPTPPPSGGGGSSSPPPSSGGSSKSTTSKTSSGTKVTAPPAPANGATTAQPGPVATSPVDVSGVTVSELSYNTATVSWKTSAPTTSEVDFGPAAYYGLSATEPTMVTDHQLVLNPKVLAAGTMYHFLVKGTDSTGQTASSNDMTFRTKGVVLETKVVDQSGHAVKGASVTLAGVTGTTNDDGIVNLVDVPEGTQKVDIVYKGTTTKTTVTTSKISIAGQSQNATIKIKVSGANTGMIIIVGGGAAIVAAVLIGRSMMRRASSSKELSRHFPTLPQSGGGPPTGSGSGNLIMPGGGSGPAAGPPATPDSSAPTTPGSTIKPNGLT